MSEAMMRGTFNPDSGFATQGADDKVFAEFYVKAEIDGAKSKEAGRPVYRDVTFCRIIQPGESRLSSIDRPATNSDVDRFPRQWAAFQRGHGEDQNEGSPLSLLFPANPGIVETLRHRGVSTIEQLANLSDSALQEIGMGARQFHEKAKAYLAKADAGKDFHTLAQRLEQQALKIEELTARNTALEAKVAENDEDKPRRGRPRTVHEPA